MGVTSAAFKDRIGNVKLPNWPYNGWRAMLLLWWSKCTVRRCYYWILFSEGTLYIHCQYFCKLRINVTHNIRENISKNSKHSILLLVNNIPDDSHVKFVVVEVLFIRTLVWPRCKPRMFKRIGVN